MNILPRANAPTERSPQRTRYHYRFSEYELHLNELAAGAATDWHHHEQVWETVVVTRGEVTLQWRVLDRVETRTLREGDVVELGRQAQRFVNRTDRVAAFLALKLVLSGQDRRALLRSDKVSDE